MAFTQDDLDAIDEAIATGESSVKFSDRTVTYRSTDDLLKARRVIAHQIRRQAGGKPSHMPRFTIDIDRGV